MGGWVTNGQVSDSNDDFGGGDDDLDRFSVRSACIDGEKVRR